MSSLDTTGNLLTTLVNAQRVGKKHVAVPYSTFSKRILEFLQQKEMIGKVRVQESPRAKLVVSLSYDDQDRPRITGVKRLSSPGRKLYAKSTEMPYSYQNFGFVVVSTSQGLMDETKARRERVGGELVCAIW